MTNRPTTPRITPLAHDEQDERMRELLPEATVRDGAVLNIFTTLVRHPGLFEKWVRFGGKLLVGKLPARDRELLILRTGWRCQSEYEWGQHVLIGRAAGITDDEVRRIKRGPEALGWSALDATLLRAADELHDDSCISDATWATLANNYDNKQLIEIPMLVGQYHLVSFCLNSLGVQREASVPGFSG
jgi:alkylhydroperoxidase family enzyme